MRRPLSNFALSAWAGFCASHAALLACAALGAAPAVLVEQATGVRLALPAAPVPAPDAAVASLALLAAAGALAASLVCLNRRRLADRAQGERIAVAALTGVAVLFGSAAVAGSPLGAVAGGATFAFSLALTLAALLFDHAMEDDSAEDDAAFRRALSAASGLRPGRDERRGTSRREGER